MDLQTEYLLEKNPLKPVRISVSVVKLILGLLLGYLVIWYFQPASAIANLPYCAGELFFKTRPQPGGGISGVFAAYPPLRRDECCYDLLRFYEDGLVMRTTATGNHVADWRGISLWFNRWSSRAKDLYGQYQLDGNQIRFTTFRYEPGWTEPLVSDGSGIYSGDTMTLTWTEHWFEDTQTSTRVFIRFDVERCPFNTSGEGQP